MLNINEIHNLSCVKGLQLLDDESIDLVVTSPPYDELREYAQGQEWQPEVTIPELYRVMKKGGVVVWVVNDQVIEGKDGGSTESCTSFEHVKMFRKAGFNLHDTMIYKKNGVPFPDKTRYGQNFEYMFVFSKGKPKTINLIKDRINRWAGAKSFGRGTERKKNGEIKLRTDHKRTVKDVSVRFNVWQYNVGKDYTTRDKIAYEHPAIFPEKLAEDHILTWTNEGDIVLDIFVGSGTTPKMALVNGRNMMGFDLSERYCEISKIRSTVCVEEELKRRSKIKNPELHALEEMKKSLNKEKGYIDKQIEIIDKRINNIKEGIPND